MRINLFVLKKIVEDTIGEDEVPVQRVKNEGSEISSTNNVRK